jgi:hypothetical protein
MDLSKIINRLNKLPNCNVNEYYRWGDFIELKCLLNKDSLYSIDEFKDLYKDTKRDSKSKDNYYSKNIDDINEPEEDEEIIFDNENKSSVNDKIERFSIDCYKIIESRVRDFDVSYPFEISNNGREISLKYDIDEKKKMYILLLISSNLWCFKDQQNSLTNSFEILSKEAMKDFLPEHAKLHLFGSGNSEPLANHEEFLQIQKFVDKIKLLAGKLYLTPILKEEDYSKYDKGDKGLDIIGWIPSNDLMPHFPLFFGQCTCSPEDWVQKQNDSKFDRWSNLIKLKTYPLNFMFIPHSFRKADGTWFQEDDIQMSILIDRNRLISHIKSWDTISQNLTSSQIIEDILYAKENIY